MKKVLMLALVAFMTLAMSQKAQAIEDPKPKGTMTIGIRGGVGYFGYVGFGGNVVGDYTLIDSWWKGHFTVGGFAGYYNYHHVSNVAFMPRATYGLNITDDFEVHLGVMTGVYWRQYSRDYYTYIHESDYVEWGFTHGEVVGCRYFFTPNFGVEAEAGYAYTMPYLNLGVTFKF